MVDSDDADDILDCNELRWIWLTWTQNSLMVGHGLDVGGSMILNWTGIANPIPINSFGFRGLQNNAVFEFGTIPRMYFKWCIKSLFINQTLKDVN